jgi:putative flavoprotein involved in K+ transport
MFATGAKEPAMTTRHVETLIIGAGQAGLANGYELQRRGRDVLIVDAVDRIGDSWRRHWDSLRLFTPGRYNSLPGAGLPGRDLALPRQGRSRRLPGDLCRGA